MFLGEISFAVYMIHQVVIRAMEQHSYRMISEHSAYATAIFVTVTISGAAALHIFFEKPVRNWMMRAPRKLANHHEVGNPAQNISGKDAT